MKVVFFSKFYPRKFRDAYLKDSRAGLAAAADAHQYALALGFKEIVDDLEIINVPALFPYPRRHKKVFIDSQKVVENGLTIDNVGYCNVQWIQPISRYYKARKKIEELIKTTNDLVYIIIYSTAPYSLQCAIEMKQKFDNVRISVIIPDLPEDMEHKVPVITHIANSFYSIFFKPFDEYMKHFDSYVLLTKYMQEKVKCDDNKFIVSEGVYDETITPRLIQQVPTGVFRIFYSGMMHKRFGVMNIVEAVIKLKDLNIELLLCGYGDAVTDIQEISHRDHRIKYLGIIPRDEALKIQCESSLLVNPRIPDNNPFTRYSFPSKTLEYFASGTPTLIYQLDGIPKEYYNYCYSLDKQNTDVDSLSDKILEIKNQAADSRQLLGLTARNFVLNKKNPKYMAGEIVELLKRTI